MSLIASEERKRKIDRPRLVAQIVDLLMQFVEGVVEEANDTRALPSEKPVSLAKAAAEAGMSAPTLRAMVDDGRVPHVVVGSQRRFVVSDVLAALKATTPVKAPIGVTPVGRARGRR